MVSHYVFARQGMIGEPFGHRNSPDLIYRPEDKLTADIARQGDILQNQQPMTVIGSDMWLL
jgi:hypothetical protein